MIQKRKAIFIAGPTASGKSQLALEIATFLQNQTQIIQQPQKQIAIINCDSVQVYQDLLIGSASPEQSEKDLFPHYLYNYLQFPQEISLGNYYRDFAELISKLDPSCVLIVVGGSGFYLQALEQGLFDMPPVPVHLRSEIQEDLLKKGAAVLYEELMAGDPETAQRIHINDHYRLTRALEVLRGQQTTLTKAAMNRQKSFDLDVLKIALRLSKQELHSRVTARTKFMMKKGIVEETAEMLAKGRNEWAPLSSVGYLETKNFLQGNIASVGVLESLIIQKTMQLIKKQMTWFKSDSAIHWRTIDQTLDSQLQIKDFLLGA
ncbi:MAG: tRNA (adenosine(37)-N6)-dimethylallyltransferase MiaA [Pseudobdellovibrionaceae bacterium]